MSRDVEFVGVGKTYENGYVAVDSLDLKIKDGEFLVLLGPSGCGKSTTLRMLAGLESITTGDILIGGNRINELPPGARDLGMVFQSYALYPHMTVRDNLSFGLRMTPRKERLPSDEIKERISETAEMLGLDSVLDSKPKTLSGGQRQRVAIGRALVRRPSVLLMDEPLSNLDAKLRNQMRIELRRLHELHGTTTVYVTHDQVEAMTLADSIAIMSDSKLQQHAPPLEAYHQPCNPFVANFLGTPSMNLLKGEIINQHFCQGELKIPLPKHLQSRTTGPCTYGVRPENIDVVVEGGHQCEIMDIEYLGDQTIYHLNCSGVQITLQRKNDFSTQVMQKSNDKEYLSINLSSNTAVLFE